MKKLSPPFDFLMVICLLLVSVQANDNYDNRVVESATYESYSKPVGLSKPGDDVSIVAAENIKIANGVIFSQAKGERSNAQVQPAPTQTPALQQSTTGQASQGKRSLYSIGVNPTTKESISEEVQTITPQLDQKLTQSDSSESSRHLAQDQKKNSAIDEHKAKKSAVKSVGLKNVIDVIVKPREEKQSERRLLDLLMHINPHYNGSSSSDDFGLII